MFEISAAQFADQQAIVAIDKFGKQGAKGDIAPTDRHMGVTSAKGYLMGLDLFRGMDRMTEIVMDMAMGYEGCNAPHLGNAIEVIEFGREMQMAKIEGHPYIVAVNLLDLGGEDMGNFRIAVGGMVQIRAGVLHGNNGLGKGIGCFLKKFRLMQ